MYILTREPPYQSSAEDLPPAEPFRATLTMAGNAESPSFCCTVMSNTSKSEKTLSAYETHRGPARLKPVFHFWIQALNEQLYLNHRLALVVMGK